MKFIYQVLLISSVFLFEILFFRFSIPTKLDIEIHILNFDEDLNSVENLNSIDYFDIILKNNQFVEWVLIVTFVFSFSWSIILLILFNYSPSNTKNKNKCKKVNFDVENENLYNEKSKLLIEETPEEIC